MNIFFIFFLQIFIFFPQIILSGPIYNDRCGCDEANGDSDKNSQYSDTHFKSYNERPNFYPKIRQRKRQVGVIYGNGRPIGILQPYKRSYKFMPVREEFDTNPLYKVDQTHNLYSKGVLSNVGKRETEEEYPSILTNFKIDSKLDKKSEKRDNDLENQEQLLDKRDVARKMRSSPNNKQTNTIEGQLKNILDDLGFMDYDEQGSREKKRESVTEELEKREDLATKSPTVTSAGEEKQATVLSAGGAVSEISETPECDRNKRLNGDQVNKNKEYEMQIVKQLQDKINSLKEQVKREIASLKEKEELDEETQRERRQNFDTLSDEENEAIDPAANVPEGDLKPLVRKRRLVTKSLTEVSTTTEAMIRKKREIEDQEDDETDEIEAAKDKTEVDLENNQRTKRSDDGNTNLNRENTDFYDYEYDQERFKRNEDELTDSEDKIEADQDDLNEKDREKRSGGGGGSAEAKNSNNGNNEPLINEAKNHENNMKARSMKQSKTRQRRRIEDLSVEQPQQLSDMSDLELFGALPPGYDGELSRFKRIKRFKNHH